MYTVKFCIYMLQCYSTMDFGSNLDSIILNTSTLVKRHSANVNTNKNSEEPSKTPWSEKQSLEELVKKKRT